MGSLRINKRNGISQDEIVEWQQVNSSAFLGKNREERTQIFERRKTAVLMYAESRSLSEIEDSTGISRQALHRLLKRCRSIHEDGLLSGFRGLLFYSHQGGRNITFSKLTQRIPAVGSLSALFVRYPLLAKALCDYVLFGKLPGLKKRQALPSFVDVHAFFIRLCDEASIKSPHYPFNSESLGRPALRRWVKKIRLQNYLAFVGANNPDEAQMITARAPDETSPSNRQHCLKRVECDGHKIDIHCVIELPSPTGSGVIRMKIQRLWIIVLIEITSGAILGYSFSFGTNYSAADIMAALRNSLIPWKRRNLTVDNIDYRDGDGFPSGTIDEFSYACFDEFHIDNAKAHLSHLFLNYLRRTVKAVPVFSPPATPNSHSYIEGFFSLLEASGIHQSIGTTGENSQDPRGKEKSSDLSYHMTFELLADFIDLLIARINGSPAPNSSLSRLEILRRITSRKTDLIRHLENSERELFSKFDMYVEKTVGLDHGRTVVRFLGVTYTNDSLSFARHLINSAVLIQADSTDLRTISCTLRDGSFAGVLYAERRWRQTKHGVITRRAALKLLRNGMFRTSSDIPIAFREYLETEARKSKKAAAAALKRTQLEQEAEPFSTPATGQKRTREIEVKEQSKEILLNEYADATKILENIRILYRQ